MEQTIVLVLNKKDSGPYFGYQVLAAEFRKLGFATVLLGAFDEDIGSQLRETYTNNNVLFTLTHNVLITDLHEDGVPFFEKYNSVCLSLTDTPLPKYGIISRAGGHVGILLGDITNGRLVQKINPKVGVFPWHGYINVTTDHTITPVSERPIDVLFAGRVGAGEIALDKYSYVKKKFGQYVSRKFGFQNEMQVDECVEHALRSPRWSLFRNAIDFDLRQEGTWNFMWNTVQHIRARRRNFILEELLALPGSVNVTIITDKEHGDRLKEKAGRNITVLDFMPWPEVLRTMSQSKITINVLPFQVNSHHERIATAQCNGSVVMTDSNPYLRSRFKDAEDIFYYFYRRHHLRDLITSNLTDTRNLDRIAANGMHAAKSNDMPEHRAKYILDVYYRYRKELDAKN